MEQGVCIRVIGNLTLLPADLVTLIAKAVLLTKDNSRAFLNVAISYTCMYDSSHLNFLISFIRYWNSQFFSKGTENAQSVIPPPTLLERLKIWGSPINCGRREHF